MANFLIADSCFFFNLALLKTYLHSFHCRLPKPFYSSQRLPSFISGHYSCCCVTVLSVLMLSTCSSATRIQVSLLNWCQATCFPCCRLIAFLVCRNAKSVQTNRVEISSVYEEIFHNCPNLTLLLAVF